MIFAVPGHIEKILMCEKTETCRASNVARYTIGQLCAVQPGRGKFGVYLHNGVIQYPQTRQSVESAKAAGFKFLFVRIMDVSRISIYSDMDDHHAMAEGGYTRLEYLKLWAKLGDKGMSRDIRQLVKKRPDLSEDECFLLALKHRPAFYWFAWRYTFKVELQ